jgi:hypothetical protein
MNIDSFPVVASKAFPVGSSFLFCGRSSSGKTHLLCQLLTPPLFSQLFKLKWEDCGKILLAFKSWQPAYSEILGHFTCPKEITSSLRSEHASSEFWPNDAGYSIAVIDDHLPDLARSGNNECFETLQRMLVETVHHSNLLLFVLVQNPGGTGSTRLRSLFRLFAYFFVFAGTDNFAVRQLASFLLPYRTRLLSSLLDMMNGRRGQHLLIDNSLSQDEHRLRCLNTNLPPDIAIDSVFTF